MKHYEQKIILESKHFKFLKKTTNVTDYRKIEIYFEEKVMDKYINKVTRSGATTIVFTFNCCWLHYFFEVVSIFKNIKSSSSF